MSEHDRSDLGDGDARHLILGQLSDMRDHLDTIADICKNEGSLWPAATEPEAVAALDAIDASDPEKAHGEADDVLLALVPDSVREAYQRVADRAEWWASA